MNPIITSEPALDPVSVPVSIAGPVPSMPPSPTPAEQLILDRLMEPGSTGLFSTRWEDRPEPEFPPYLVQDLLPQGTLNMLVSPGGVGKTKLMIELAHCIVNGLPFKDREVLGRGPVLLIDNEMGPKGIYDYCDEIGMQGQFMALHDVSTSDLVPIITLAHREGCRLVIIDSYTSLIAEMSTSGGELMNSAVATEQLLRPLLTLAHTIGITIVVLHHIGKDNTTFVGSQRILSLPDEMYELSLNVESQSMTLKARKNRSEIAPLTWTAADHPLLRSDTAAPVDLARHALQEAFVMDQLKDGPAEKHLVLAQFKVKFSVGDRLFRKILNDLTDRSAVVKHGKYLELSPTHGHTAPAPEIQCAPTPLPDGLSAYTRSLV